jgi:hypothetical protein
MVVTCGGQTDVVKLMRAFLQLFVLNEPKIVMDIHISRPFPYDISSSSSSSSSSAAAAKQPISSHDLP